MSEAAWTVQVLVRYGVNEGSLDEIDFMARKSEREKKESKGIPKLGLLM